MTMTKNKYDEPWQDYWTRDIRMVMDGQEYIAEIEEPKAVHHTDDGDPTHTISAYIHDQAISDPQVKDYQYCQTEDFYLFKDGAGWVIHSLCSLVPANATKVGFIVDLDEAQDVVAEWLKGYIEQHTMEQEVA